MNNGSVIKWELSRLREHPRQQELFGDVPEHELDALAADMQKNGLQHPVEILPDGTIVAGHQRVRAAKRLGWEKIDVVICKDLEAAGPAAVEAYLIRDNLVRRQLTPLGQARCIRSLLELESSRRASRFRWREKEKLKASIGEQLGMSVRSVNRYLLVMDAPSEVQKAFDLGQLALIPAGRVSLLKQQDQCDIARRIRDSEPAKHVVDEYLNHNNGHADHPTRAARRLFRALAAEVPRLQANPGGIHSGLLQKHVPVLRKAAKLFDQLVAQVEDD